MKELRSTICVNENGALKSILIPELSSVPFLLETKEQIDDSLGFIRRELILSASEHNSNIVDLRGASVRKLNKHYEQTKTTSSLAFLSAFCVGGWDDDYNKNAAVAKFGLTISRINDDGLPNLSTGHPFCGCSNSALIFVKFLISIFHRLDVDCPAGKVTLVVNHPLLINILTKISNNIFEGDPGDKTNGLNWLECLCFLQRRYNDIRHRYTLVFLDSDIHASDYRSINNCDYYSEIATAERLSYLNSDHISTNREFSCNQLRTKLQHANIVGFLFNDGLYMSTNLLSDEKQGVKFPPFFGLDVLIINKQSFGFNRLIQNFQGELFAYSTVDVINNSSCTKGLSVWGVNNDELWKGAYLQASSENSMINTLSDIVWCIRKYHQRKQGKTIGIIIEDENLINFIYALRSGSTLNTSRITKSEYKYTVNYILRNLACCKNIYFIFAPKGSVDSLTNSAEGQRLASISAAKRNLQIIRVKYLDNDYVTLPDFVGGMNC
ncbi:hypothetical protein GLP21_12655 [Photobacterium carnosum]|uniref:Uncharacterized protein n=1 Tax=Photobacterium carnosum TaxID=2023717 RepID=A0A2N4UWD4_9GAMM|nr:MULTISPECIES: hypothetical protein [Photobacterium]MCD9477241.1 hypothetical protein [Photobacterium phosphoreum]MCD9508772.1 hypothetical protein [Photobacterium phosphoreum]MCD9539305.1 hypothetical protein [Photobacterium carnosum]MCD9543024.1 hypothetical protein [Photobacterium carnosum]MCD9546807.1 hypothetical protein [Photobacterium carnosum]